MNLLPLPALLLGFAATWFLLPNDAEKPNTAHAPATRSHDRPTTTRDHDFSGLIEKLKSRPGIPNSMRDLLPEAVRAALGDSPEDSGLEDLTAAELGDLLLAVMRGYQTDATYFDSYDLYFSDEWGIMEKAFGAMYAKDPAAAVDWIMALEHKGDRRPFLYLAMKQESKRDFDSALALFDEISERMGEPMDVPHELMSKAVAAQGADGLLRVIAAGMRENGKLDPEAYWAPEYPKDFDFQAALDGIAALERDAPEGHAVSAIPDDILSQWMERDPEAAKDWFLSGNRVTENGVESFFRQYAETANAAEVGGMAARLLASGKDGTANYGEAWRALSLSSDRDVINSFFSAEPVAANAAEHAQGLLRASMEKEIYADLHRQVAVSVQENLLSVLNEEQRREFIRQEAPRIEASDTLRTRFTSMLAALGHSSDEIAELLPTQNPK